MMPCALWIMRSAQQDGEHGEGRRASDSLVIRRKKMRVGSSEMLLHTLLPLLLPRHSLLLLLYFCCDAHIRMLLETQPLFPWLAKVTGRPQPSGSDSPAVPLSMESFLSIRQWSRQTAAELAMQEIIFTHDFFFFTPSLANAAQSCAAPFITRRRDAIIPRWALPAGCRWTLQAEKESKD